MALRWRDTYGGSYGFDDDGLLRAQVVYYDAPWPSWVAHVGERLPGTWPTREAAAAVAEAAVEAAGPIRRRRPRGRSP